MSNATFQTATAGSPPPDMRKHVKYTQGMVLGVDDFTQEFAYLSNRDQWLAREAIGYGTVTGLHLSLTSRDGDTEISVSPGVAINPRGQLIRVAPRQCARVGAWLRMTATQERLAELGLGGASSITAYVVLCYRDCPVDDLPVPGEPCRCDSETMAPSRILDDFRLELTLTPPPQQEEDAVRDFVAWLREIEIADFTPAPGELEAFLDAIRTSATGIDSPPLSPPDFLYGSPPSGLRIPRTQLCAWMRVAMRLWVTELRPLWQAQCAPRAACGCGGPCGCHGTGTEPEGMDCDCLLLSQVNITRAGGTLTDVTLNEERRPYLIHLRMLQELMLCGPCCGEGYGACRSFATVWAEDLQTLRIWIHHPFPLDVTTESIALRIDGVPVEDFAATPVAGNIFDITLLGSPLGLFQSKTPIELEFDASLIQESGRDLATAIWQEGYHYLDYTEPRLRVHTVLAGFNDLAGDVVGPPAQNELRAIQGAPLDLTGLADGRVLVFQSGEWRPLPLPAPSNALPAAETFGNPGTPGSPATIFALADHVHPMPEDPVPPHNQMEQAHRNLRLGSVAIATPASSDVQGIAENNVVVGLQGVPVSDATLGATDDGSVLTYRANANQWTAEPAVTSDTFRVTSGSVIFKQVEPGSIRFSPEIKHGFEKQLVMIRLGLEERGGTFVEDVAVDNGNGIFENITESAPPPQMLVVYVNGKRVFVVYIQDRRNEEQPVRDWIVRWWAVPVTEAFDPITVPGNSERQVPRAIIEMMVSPDGITVAEIAKRLEISESRIQPVVDRLKAEGAIRVTRGRILPPS